MVAMIHRRDELDRFYALLANLEQRVGGPRRLSNTEGKQGWPERGVYFFFEPGETRPASSQARVIRVGAHAVSSGSKTTLWDRLRTHRGTATLGGNHRGSIFRLRVGEALQAREGILCPTWAQGSSAPKEVRVTERAFEEAVSRTLNSPSVLWLAVEDEPGPQSLRAYLERNSLALLSHFHPEADPPSAGWLGRHAAREDIQRSGLWNSDHVRATHDPVFLDMLEEWVNRS